MMKRDRKTFAAHYEAIGAVVVAAAELDDDIAELIRFLVTGEPLIGRIITGRVGFTPRLEMFRSLVAYRTRNKDVLDTTKDFAKRAEAAVRRRDELAHGLWGARIKDGKADLGKWRPHVKHGVTLTASQETVDELNTAAAELEGCLSDLAKLRVMLLPYLFIPHIRPDKTGRLRATEGPKILTDDAGPRQKPRRRRKS